MAVQGHLQLIVEAGRDGRIENWNSYVQELRNNGPDDWRVDLLGSDLRETVLIDAKLDSAFLTGARLWKSTRDGWSVVNVVCEWVSWDREGKEFERLHTCELVKIEYPSGIKPHQYYSFPAVLGELQSRFVDRCVLQFRSLGQGPGNNDITIAVMELQEGESREVIANEIQQAVRCLEEGNKAKMIQIQHKVEAFQNVYLKAITIASDRAPIPMGVDSPRSGKEEHLSVFISDLEDFSSLGSKQSVRALDDMQGQFALQLERSGARICSTRGDAVVGGFHDPVEGIECVLRIQAVMKAMGYRLRIGMDHGSVWISKNRIAYRPDGVSDALNYASRLEPLCAPGRVLVSQKLYQKLCTSDRFTFEEFRSTLDRGAAGMPAGQPMAAHYVEEKPNTGR